MGSPDLRDYEEAIAFDLAQRTDQLAHFDVKPIHNQQGFLSVYFELEDGRSGKVNWDCTSGTFVDYTF